MENEKIVCKPTSWFKTRVIGMGILFLGTGLYFFYDATTGYPSKNEVYFTHKAFEQAGQDIETVSTPSEWEAKAIHAAIDFHGYPVPAQDRKASTPWPEEMKDYQLMKNGWYDAWMAYTTRMRLPIKPVDTPFDDGKIREQWIAGGVSCLLFLACAYLFIRTSGRVMSIDGRNIQAAGKSFTVGDITKLDLRKWKDKGIAYAYLGGTKIRLDGFCYGGFPKGDEQTGAESFMKALLARYDGDIIDYQAPVNEAPNP